MFGTALGFVLFGIGGALWVLFLSRVIDGLTGGDNSVLFAYLADISKPEERGKLFGRIGGLVGVGFIIGPAIGGFAATWGYSVPFYLAAVIFLITIVWGLFVMPESLPPEKRVQQIKRADLNPFAQIGNVFAITRLRWLIVASLCHGLPFAMFTTLLTVLLFDTLHWQPGTIGLLLLANGTIDIIMQGFISERLIARWGEVRLTIAGLIGLALSFGLIGVIAIVPEPLIVFVGIVCFAVSSGLLEPSLRALIANATPDEAQGMVQGSTTALLAATNIAAPIIAGTLYTQFGGETPYWLGAVILLLGIGVMRLASQQLDMRPPVEHIVSKMS
jgi:DHA1 family tetracycline resistance protein-like MFS transporter